MTFESLQPKLGEYFDIESFFKRAHLTANPLAWFVDASGSGHNHFAIGERSVDFLPEALYTDIDQVSNPILENQRFYGLVTYEGKPSWFLANSWLETDAAGVVTSLSGDWGFLAELPEVDEPGVVEFRSLEDSDLGGDWRHSKTEYRELIEECQRMFAEGDVKQLCLTNLWESRASIDEISTWLRLLSTSTSPYCGFLRVGGEVLISASPECFISITDGHIKTSPIKGTRPRFEDVNMDEQMRQELAASPKEIEENSTIAQAVVDELVPVCKPNTAVLTESLVVRSFAQVHQLISTIEGELLPEVNFREVLATTFPAGSMTGFPKEVAVPILERLEEGERGIYSGCFGFLEKGRVELGMVIRSLVKTPERIYIGAGGGLTRKSDPDAEVAEAWYKAKIVLESIAWMP